MDLNELMWDVFFALVIAFFIFIVIIEEQRDWATHRAIQKMAARY